VSYRFSLPIPHTITQNYGNQPIYVYGISPYGLDNSLIANSGSYQVPAVDRSVTGFISGIVLENQQYYLRGWACAKTYSGSIEVHLYAGGPYGSGTFVTSAAANLSSNPTTTAMCNTGATSYGFSIVLPLALRQQFGGQLIYVHGISPFGLGNPLLNNSGSLVIPGGAAATLSWKQDYIRDGAGITMVVAKPAPSDATPPTAPINLTVTNTTATSVSLSWPASTSWGGASPLGYRIYRQLGTGPSLPIGAVTTTTFQDTTVQSGKTYTYTVVAVNAAEIYSSDSPGAQSTTP
jgi:hypothetical protein